MEGVDDPMGLAGSLYGFGWIPGGLSGRGG